MFDWDQKLNQILANQSVIVRKLTIVSSQLAMLTQLETKMAKSLDDLTADVQAETTVSDSIEALVLSLAAQVADLKTKQTDPATAAKIDELAQKLEANTGKLSAAVSANTPAPAPASNVPAAPVSSPDVPATGGVDPNAPASQGTTGGGSVPPPVPQPSS